jgi:hypothetical protein
MIDKCDRKRGSQNEKRASRLTSSRSPLLKTYSCKLNFLDVLGSRTLCALLHVKAHPVAFFKAFEAC